MQSKFVLFALIAVTVSAEERHRRPSPFGDDFDRKTRPAKTEPARTTTKEAVAKDQMRARTESSVLPVSDGPREILPPGVLIACFFRVTTESTDGFYSAAHPTLPKGTKLKVTNIANSKSVTVRITDRVMNAEEFGISVSRAAAEELGFVKFGTARVRVEELKDSADQVPASGDTQR